MHEEVADTSAKERFTHQKSEPSRPIRVKDVSQTPIPRIVTRIQEFDRLLGGGIVPGALTLVGGDPASENPL